MQLALAAAARHCLVLLIATPTVVNLTSQIHHLGTRAGRYQRMCRRQHTEAQEHEHTHQGRWQNHTKQSTRFLSCTTCTSQFFLLTLYTTTINKQRFICFIKRQHSTLRCIVLAVISLKSQQNPVLKC